MVGPGELCTILSQQGLAPAKVVAPLAGGTGEVYRVDLIDGTCVVLKSNSTRRATPER